MPPCCWDAITLIAPVRRLFPKSDYCTTTEALDTMNECLRMSMPISGVRNGVWAAAGKSKDVLMQLSFGVRAVGQVKPDTLWSACDRRDADDRDAEILLGDSGRGGGDLWAE